MNPLNDPILIAKRDHWFAIQESLYQGSYQEPRVFVIDGVLSVGKSDPYREPEKWVDKCLADIARQKASAILSDFKFRPVCVEYGIYGVHYVDKILGANVYWRDGQWYNDYLKTPIGELPDPDLENNETFQLSVRAAKRFAEVGGEFPLFGLPTIASALNIAVNLYGQEILMEMLDDPENARKDLETINRVLIKIHETFREILPQRQLQPVVSWERTQPPRIRSDLRMHHPAGVGGSVSGDDRRSGCRCFACVRKRRNDPSVRQSRAAHSHLPGYARVEIGTAPRSRRRGSAALL